MYVTKRPELDLPTLPAAGGRKAGALRRHELTVVLLDGRGVRISEAAWTLVLYAGHQVS